MSDSLSQLFYMSRSTAMRHTVGIDFASEAVDLYAEEMGACSRSAKRLAAVVAEPTVSEVWAD